MANYATVIEMREYLPQLLASGATDATLTKILARATQIIDTYLGYSFTVASEVASAQTVYGDGTDYLVLPTFISGSVTGVTAPTGYSVPDYIEQSGALVIARDGVIGLPYGRGTIYHYGVDYAWPAGWLSGVPYTVTARYGVAAIPADIVEACLEIAIRIWKAKDAGFSDVVGVGDGGAVGYNGALPNMVKMVLNQYKHRNIGVW